MESSGTCSKRLAEALIDAGESISKARYVSELVLSDDASFFPWIHDISNNYQSWDLLHFFDGLQTAFDDWRSSSGRQTLLELDFEGLRSSDERWAEGKQHLVACLGSIGFPRGQNVNKFYMPGEMTSF